MSSDHSSAGLGVGEGSSSNRGEGTSLSGSAQGGVASGSGADVSDDDEPPHRGGSLAPSYAGSRISRESRSPRPHLPEVKPSQLGYFDPSESEATEWWREVTSMVKSYEVACHDDEELIRSYHTAILMALPKCLKGGAKKWWSLLTEVDRRILSTDLSAWWKLFVNEFSDSLRVRRIRAKERAWDHRNETCRDYALDKMAKIRDVEPDIGEEELVLRVKEGIPAPYSLQIAEHKRAKPRVRLLMDEIRDIDDAVAEMKIHRKKKEASKSSKKREVVQASARVSIVEKRQGGG